ncbi:MAG: flagellar hook-basal body complex protein FliE, partial [Planctomycetaceae bacterium]|nr:flagellar hook-basal body complex protein FliE [Planctomycetaceae bacterium]
GGDVTKVEVLSSIKKADLALRTMIQVRNKMLDAYREVINLRM